MPTIGPFHRNFWRARANTPPPPGTANAWMYPGWQSSVTMLAIWGVPWELLAPLWRQLRWIAGIVWQLWAWRDPIQQARLETWIARLAACPFEERVVLERVWIVLQSPYWADTLDRVAACATTPKFHQPEQWLAYSRALKANAGQAQNVFRHIKVVHELKDRYPTLSNPDAHLLTELGYQAFAARGRPEAVH